MEKLLLAVNPEYRKKLFSEIDLKRMNSFCDVINIFPQEEKVTKEFLLEHIGAASIVVTSWGTAALDADVMAKAKNLKLLTHAAGTVKPVVSDALWDNGIRVTSAAAAIAFGVAEFCLGLILTATKRAFWAGIDMRRGLWRSGTDSFCGPTEIYQQKIGIIGASHVGRHLIRLLKNFTCDILLYDPYLSSDDAVKMGVTKIDSLDELFSQCLVVSLNAPITEQTRHMIRGEHFAKFKPGSLFINTARGAIVNEAEMIEELRKGQFVACIDVTDPEPPLLDSPLRNLPNVWLTPHEAGAIAHNLLRVGTFATDEIEAFLTGKPLHYEVKKEQLSRIG